MNFFNKKPQKRNTPKPSEIQILKRNLTKLMLKEYQIQKFLEDKSTDQGNNLYQEQKNIKNMIQKIQNRIHTLESQNLVSDVAQIQTEADIAYSEGYLKELESDLTANKESPFDKSQNELMLIKAKIELEEMRKDNFHLKKESKK